MEKDFHVILNIVVFVIPTFYVGYPNSLPIQVSVVFHTNIFVLLCHLENHRFNGGYRDIAEEFVMHN